ncbi:CehA/McbA family metallohydrolase [Verrucomicrobiota bacterium]
MAAPRSRSRKKFGAQTRTVDLSAHLNWPKRMPRDEWWQTLAKNVRNHPSGNLACWGIPFVGSGPKGPRVVLLALGKQEITVPLNASATHLCVLHAWPQIPGTIRREDPAEGLVVGEYELNYAGGSSHVQMIRARFEVAMAESPGPPWLAMPSDMNRTIDPAGPVPERRTWGHIQPGLLGSYYGPQQRPIICAIANPFPEKRIRSVTMRGLQESPLLVCALTLYRGEAHPLAHLPRRTYRVNARGGAQVRNAEIDMGVIARIEHTDEPRSRSWVDSPYRGDAFARPAEGKGENLIEVVGAPDATVSVEVEQSGRSKSYDFSLGEAFQTGAGRSKPAGARLEVLGSRRQWMQIRVLDSSTGRPTPARVHFSGSRGEYIAPYGHHAQVNTNWFEDYGADVVVAGRNCAYVPGEFTSDMPVGDVYVEICKGFEYEPVRSKITIRPGQKRLDLKIKRWKDLRRDGWVTADTHVHFISPHTAWLEGQAEGINVVNLLASQWGRLFTNVGDITGRVGVVEDDTIVYVGTENRNHMLGHMSMLGTKGLPVYPMCCGGPGESWVGDPDFMTLAEWAIENKRKGGVVVRPHYPFCGHTEDPVPILKGLVDALEINPSRDGGFPVQEWYRYLNCGYKVAVAGGTDKMSAQTALGWLRTYAKLDPNRPFNYPAWARAVRAGRTLSTNGPLLGLEVEGREIGETISIQRGGGTLSVKAWAESVLPMGVLEIVCNGRVVASSRQRSGARRLRVSERVKLPASGWIAARCYGQRGRPGAYQAAHTSPVYVKCGDTRLFDGPAAEHMLALVEGGIEYLRTISTAFDESSRKRMVKLFKEAQAELKGRLVVEAGHPHHHGKGPYHTHGHGKAETGHKH